MKKEFEAYRSNLYAFILLIVSALALITTVTFFVVWIEWSLPIIIISFIVFVAFLLGFILLYVKKTIAFYVTKKEIVFCENAEAVIKLEDVESVDIKSNLVMISLNVRTNEKEQEFSYFVADLKKKKAELIELLTNLGINLIDNSVILTKSVD